ncbi:MAG: FkbM family methyltransferase, partial [Candidatus Sumerlaeia bacterium]|nr:FkbM family methyltransferase [Candidatus Sumerlaeia bacterium]
MQYPAWLTVPLYKTVLGISGNRGLHTIARWDSRLFPMARSLAVAPGSPLRLHLPAHPHFIGYVLGNHEPHILSAIRDCLPVGGTYVDVGANLGYFCVHAAYQLGPSGSIYAFEPNRENFALLESNRMSLKNHANVTTYKEGVSRAEGTAELSLGPHSTYHSLERRFDSGATESVPITTLDAWFAKTGVSRIDLLKIDVEGHEPAVLEGASKSIAEGRIKSIVLECREQ